MANRWCTAGNASAQQTLPDRVLEWPRAMHSGAFGEVPKGVRTHGRFRHEGRWIWMRAVFPV